MAYNTKMHSACIWRKRWYIRHLLKKSAKLIQNVKPDNRNTKKESEPIMHKRPKFDYTPEKTPDGWKVHSSFITSWLIRGDVEKLSENTWIRLSDDQYLSEHKKGDIYTIKD